jgi:hypothetical protein
MPRCDVNLATARLIWRDLGSGFVDRSAPSGHSSREPDAIGHRVDLDAHRDPLREAHPVSGPPTR